MSPLLQLLLVALAGWVNQQQRDVIDYLREENRVLREQLGPRRLRFTDAQRRRLAARAQTVGRRVLRNLATIVTPDTLLAWHRTLIAKKYGRKWPSWSGTTAGDGRDSGADRADGPGQSRVGLHADPGSSGQCPSRRLPRHHCRGPPRTRPGLRARALKKTTWAEFLRTHWDVLAAADFFTVHVWTGRGLTRFAVLFVIELSTRRVEVAGIAAEPDAPWLSQISRNVRMPTTAVSEVSAI